MKTSEICQDQSIRRRLIRAHTNDEGEHDLNGIDYLEVDESQRILTVFFLGKAPEKIRKRNVRVEGGTRIRGIRVEAIRLCRIDDPERDDCLKVFVDQPGDFSIYTLRLVNAYGGQPSDEPLDGFDPRYAQIDFSFKANCPTDLDCQPQNVCAHESLNEPEINYLAKDYASFRQLILDRLALIMPQWKERHVPDIGIALVEILAYTGDYLSYYQDAVATESYLDTARRRISVRRHATLVDYQMHEGSNARVWVCVEVNINLTGINPREVYFITRANSSLPADSNAPASPSGVSWSTLVTEELQNVAASKYDVFEPLVQDASQLLDFYQAHNRLSFYTWQDRECCLPRGATSATLIYQWRQQRDTPAPDQPYGDDYRQVAGHEKQEQKPQQQSNQQQTYQRSPASPEQTADEQDNLRLKIGDLLIFEEVRGPYTGEKEDADPSHRHAVRLTKVEPDIDPLTGTLIVNIEWARDDALPFALCISSIGRAPDCKTLTDVSVARGNVVLCDHGRTVRSDKWRVPAEGEEDAGCIGPGEPRETTLSAGHFRPVLDHSPLTHCVPLRQSSLVARHQATALGELMKRVRARLIQLLKKARHHDALSRAELDELKVIFGEKNLEQVGLASRGKKDRPATSAEEQASAIERLLSRMERFLEKKRKRLMILRRRALAGYVLTELEHQELSEMFGQNLIAALGLKGDAALGPASAALSANPSDAVPCIVVYESLPENSADGESEANEGEQRLRWTPERNLLSSLGGERHFVAEIDDEGFAHLRFGDGDLGRAPASDSILQAVYRVGQGLDGNVGAEAIAHLVFREHRTGTPQDVLRVRNPLPARGGTEPEPLSEVKLYAPSAFRKVLQRAITKEDYASLAAVGNSNTVQQASAELRWNGSWHEMQVAIDPRGTQQPDEQLFEEVNDSLASFRRIGHDLSVRLARYVPLHIELTVCVLPQYLRGHVKAALADLFSNRKLPDGQLGLFHPDNLTFGDSIYLSRLVATAQGVAGVETVKVNRLERLYEGSHGEIEKGVLPLNLLEVAQLDNDPSFPERGLLLLTMRGGR
jgi:predicted phage baseplate assembly protein